MAVLLSYISGINLMSDPLMQAYEQPLWAIRAEALERINMRDQAYGWTVEMQVKAIRQGMRIREVPVDSMRRRFGKSKVGGTFRGVVGASVGIVSMIFALRLGLK